MATWGSHGKSVPTISRRFSLETLQNRGIHVKVWSLDKLANFCLWRRMQRTKTTRRVRAHGKAGGEPAGQGRETDLLCPSSGLQHPEGRDAGKYPAVRSPNTTPALFAERGQTSSAIKWGSRLSSPASPIGSSSSLRETAKSRLCYILHNSI